MHRSITPHTSLDNLKREAKRWLYALRAGDAEARDRLVAVWPDAPAKPSLRDVQQALALEYGLPGWIALRDRLAATETVSRYAHVADSLVRAYARDDLEAMRTL